MKKYSRVIITVVTILVLIFVAVVGFNVYKNRWHKIDFNVDSITVTQLNDNQNFETARYSVVIKGTAKAWFYDLNTYKFNLTQNSKGSIPPIESGETETLVVNNRRKATFEYSLVTNDYNDVFDYILSAENIYVHGRNRENLDIRLFMSDYSNVNITFAE